MADSPYTGGGHTNGEPTPLSRMLASGLQPSPAAPPPAPPAAPARPVNPPTAGPGDTAAVEALPGALPVAWDVVHDLRKQVVEEIDSSGRELSGEDRQELGRSVIASQVSRFATGWALEHQALTRGDEVALQELLFNQIFRAGAIQPYLDDPATENIMIDGHDRVWVEYFDRPTRRVPPVAESDEALVQWVNLMARRSGAGERQLSDPRPMVHFRLPDGSRVAATLLTTRPAVAIRKHRVLRYTLDDMINWGTLDPILAAFLTAAVRGKLNVLIAGDMGVGKTSLLRALGQQVPGDERLMTLETDRELYLDEIAQAHTLAFEGRESGGERTSDGRPVGEITVADMFPHALRFNGHRVIVGEVRSVEVYPMLESMAAGGSGSLCTLHARRASDVLDRLLYLLNRAGMSDDAASKLVAGGVDLVVYLRQVNRTSSGGRRWRFVSHVLEVTGIGEQGRPAVTEIFGPLLDAGEPRAVPRMMPQRCLQQLLEGGFDSRLMQQERGQWPQLGFDTGRGLS